MSKRLYKCDYVEINSFGNERPFITRKKPATSLCLEDANSNMNGASTSVDNIDILKFSLSDDDDESENIIFEETNDGCNVQSYLINHKNDKNMGVLRSRESSCGLTQVARKRVANTVG